MKIATARQRSANDTTLVTRDGQPFDPTASAIRLRGSGTIHSFRFDLFEERLEPIEAAAIRAYIVNDLQNLAVATARHHQLVLARHTRLLQVGERLSSIEALKRCKKDGEDRNVHDQFRYVKEFLLYCSERFPGVCDPETMYEISQWRLRNRETHLALKEGDPDFGPLSPPEEAALRSALNGTDLDGEMYNFISGQTVRNALTTVLNLGVRPYQATLMLDSDVVVIDKDSDAYGLLIPRIKNGTPTRASLRLRPLTKNHYEGVRSLIEQNLRIDRDEPYLFGRSEKGRSSLSNAIPPERLSEAFSRWGKDAGLKSTEHSGPLRLNAYRLRYTFATNMSAELSPAELADLLDHVTTHTVMVYYNLRLDFSHRLEKALEHSWSKYAKLFLGNVESIPDSVAEEKVILSATYQTKVARLGLCGSQTLCNLYPPLSCYLCPKFQADPDADHEDLLRTLMEVQNQRLEQTARVRDRLKSQLDKVVIAVKQLLEIVRVVKWARMALESGIDIPKLSDGRVDMEAIAAISDANPAVVVEDAALRNLLQQAVDSHAQSLRLKQRRSRV